MKDFLRKVLVNYLAWAARKAIKKYQPLIIGITGSAGKTSTKEAVYAVLHEKFTEKVFKAGSNLNSEIGLPLAVLRCEHQPENLQWSSILFGILFRILANDLYPKKSILILEYAADRPGDIEYLVGLARPTIGIVTEIGPAHLDKFKLVENVAGEKGKLVAALPPDGLAILNRRNPWVYGLGKLTRAEKIYIEAETENLSNQIAKAIGRHFKMSDKEIQSGLNKNKNPKGRLNLIDGRSGSIIIDDSYNANPLSMKLALRILDQRARQIKAKRKIAVLGDMADLGDYTEKAHLEIGALARKTADLLITVGPNSKLMDGHFWFPSPQMAASFLLSEIRQGDIILVKASHATGLDKIVEKIKA